MSSTRPSVRLSILIVFLVPILAGAVQPSGLAQEGDHGTHDHAAEECVSETVYVHAVGDACRLADGLWQVTLPDGHVGTTHGPDPYHGDDPATTALVANEREPVCANDYHQHILYGYHAENEDRSASVEGMIRKAIRQMNWILNQDALESGGVTADYKVLCDNEFRMRIDSFAVPSSSADFSVVVSAARAAGFDERNADYSIFFDGSSAGVCGVGHMSYDERPGEENANNRGGDYAVTYRSCWTGRTPMHENGHNQGAVQRTAPDSDLTGHCIEGYDIMCYPTSYFLRFCTDRTHFDCDHDTYFDAEPEPGEWLDSHWNIGSRVNRFITFDIASQDPNRDPVAAFTMDVDGDTISVDASGSADPEGATLDYDWTFGDGTTATGVTATHTYTESGRYDVGLWVSDGAGGTDTEVKEAVILPDVEASVTSLGFDGHIACAVAYRPVVTTDRCADLGLDDDAGRQVFRFVIDAGADAMRVTIDWDRTRADGDGRFGAEQMSYVWTNPPGLGAGRGEAPLVGEDAIEPGSNHHLEGGNVSLSVRSNGQTGLVKGQDFHVCIDIMYGGAATPETPGCA